VSVRTLDLRVKWTQEEHKGLPLFLPELKRRNASTRGTLYQEEERSFRDPVSKGGMLHQEEERSFRDPVSRGGALHQEEERFKRRNTLSESPASK